MTTFNFFWGNFSDVIIRVNALLTEEEKNVFKSLYPNSLIIVEENSQILKSKQDEIEIQTLLQEYSLDFKNTICGNTNQNNYMIAA